MSNIKIGINGMGRIGCLVLKAAFSNKDVEVVSVNIRPTDKIEDLINKILNDDIHGKFNGCTIKAFKEHGFDFLDISTNDRKMKIQVTRTNRPECIPWKLNNIKYVVDGTGVFRDTKTLKNHFEFNYVDFSVEQTKLLENQTLNYSYDNSFNIIENDDKSNLLSKTKFSDNHTIPEHVVLCCPPNDNLIPVFVMGANTEPENFIKKKKMLHIVSNASCTSNASAPIIKLLRDNLEKTLGFQPINNTHITSTHAITQSQDQNTRMENIVCHYTGAEKSLPLIFPDLDVEKNLTTKSFRVPVKNVSIIDCNFSISEPNKKISKEFIEKIFEKASKSKKYKDIISCNYEPMDKDMSSKYNNDSHSAIINMQSITYKKNNKTANIGLDAWYDNEWGYSNRIIDLIVTMENALKIEKSTEKFKNTNCFCV